MIKNSSLKNIIFDLGGVIVNLNESATVKAFGANISTFFEPKLNPEFVTIAHKFECGKISASDFRNEVRKIFKLDISDYKFNNAWNAMIVGVPESRNTFLKNLKKDYHIFALSNTNEIHYDCFSNKPYWKPELFEKTYFSQKIAVRKPNPEIFELVLNENNLHAEETLFLDDNKDNCLAAEKLGIKTIHVVKPVENYFIHNLSQIL